MTAWCSPSIFSAPMPPARRRECMASRVMRSRSCSSTRGPEMSASCSTGYSAMVMCEGSLITPKDLQLGPVTGAARVSSLASAREGIERLMVEEALVRNDYNIAATARDLRISRVTLYRLLARLRIDAKHHASAESAMAAPTVGILERAR